MNDTAVSALINQLDNGLVSIRWDAVVALARMPVHDDFNLVWEAIESRIEGEPIEALRGQMAQALSMISARNMPSGMFYGGRVPDFLSTWEEFRAGIEHPPSPQDWDSLSGHEPL